MADRSPAASVYASARRAAGRVARRLGFRRPAPAPPARPARTDPAAPRPASRVDLISTREIVGVLEAGRDAAPQRLTLFVNELAVDHVDVAPAGEAPAAFRFRTRDMWHYCGPKDRITVRRGSDPLPMPDGSPHHSPTAKAKRPLSELEERLAAGEIINSRGNLSLPKYLDATWQQSVTRLYGEVDQAVHEIIGHHPFLVYGSLLGAVREGRPLGHDHDFDTAYLSAHPDPEEVAAEAGRLALALQERGFSVEARATCIHIADAGLTERIDLYHFFFNDSDELRLAWGSVSDIPFRKDQWAGLEQIQFAGATVFAPRNAEALVAHLYGPNWRVPNPGFSWERERGTRAKEAAFPAALRPVINWQDHWLHHAFDAPTSFAHCVDGLQLAPGLVVDLGCGDGRDVPRFVRSGARVLGLDYTPAAVESARRRGLAQDRASFERCDLAAPGALREQLDALPQPLPRTLFYARHLLDSISDAARATLLAELEALARPGDMIAVEFRALGDDTLHYHERLNCGRRVVDPSPIRDWLAGAGFETVVDLGGSGWEKAGSKPVLLHRFVAVKPTAGSSPDRPSRISSVTEHGGGR